MATNFSPCKGSYVLNQFPSNVMFGMNGFHVSASGAIQGHHGPLVFHFHRLIESVPYVFGFLRHNLPYVVSFWFSHLPLDFWFSGKFCLCFNDLDRVYKINCLIYITASA